MMKASIIIIVHLLLFASPAYSQAGSADFNGLSFGHLLTPNNRTLERGEFSVGTLYLATGLTDNLTLATSPFIAAIHQVFNLHTRFAFNIGQYSRLGIDVAYFKSMNNRINYKDTYCLRDSQGGNRCYGATRIFRSYIMEATSFKLTFNQLISPRYRFNLSLGHFYYFDSRMPFSFHMDPANGDKFSVSLSSLHELRLNNQLFVGIELGGWGLNYQYPYYHLGFSLNYQLHQFLVGLGVSTTFSPSFPKKSVREFPGYDSRASYHPEIEIQYFF